MKHKIKVFTFFLFILCILALGIREVNYNNYEIIENGTKEVVIITADNKQTHIKIFGEDVVINEKVNETIKNIISKFNY